MTPEDARVEAQYPAARTFLETYLAASPAERRAIFAALRPTADDYRAVFVPAVALRAARGYQMLWGNTAAWPIPPLPVFEVACASVGMLAAGATGFPGGYEAITAWLQPEPIWIAWSVSTRGRTNATQLDGLVQRAPDRWAWFPRPWKVLPPPPLPSIYEVD